MKKLVFAIIIASLTSCVCNDSAHISAMDADIARKEMQLDRFAEVFDFDDTVGEGDSCADLVEALKAYRRAHTLNEKEEAYDKYVEAYNKVYNESWDVINQKERDE